MNDGARRQRIAVIREHDEAMHEGCPTLAARIRRANPDLYHALCLPRATWCNCASCWAIALCPDAAMET